METPATARPDDTPASGGAYQALSPGQHVGGYRVERLLGGGGMGQVYLAHDDVLGRPVAVKVMHADLAADRDARQRFLAEGRAEAGLHNDHVVPVLRAGEEGGRLFLVMPYLQGESLEERLKRPGPLPVAEALRVAREAALGLEAAHRAGQVHRDVKPANLWLETPGDKVLLLDFGLVHRADMALTRTGDVLGTPAYMSPEQVDGLPVDGRSDLFSLGCVLYRMLTGVRPFDGPTVTAVYRALAECKPVPPCQRRGDVPREVSDFVMRLLARQPKDRPQSASEVVTALAALERRPPRPARRRGWLVAAGVVLIVTTASAAVGWRALTGAFVSAPQVSALPTTAGSPTPEPANKAQPPSTTGPVVPPTTTPITPTRPAALKAPFTQAEARAAQEAWSKYLGRAVEEEIDLGGGVKLVLVLIPPGTFTMGSPRGERDREDDEDTHEVQVTRPFYLGKYSVTQGQYEAVTGKNPSSFFPEQEAVTGAGITDTGRFPVEQVSWDDADAFCRELQKRVKRGKVCLPCEAQREYACRAGTETPFHFGATLDGRDANCDGNYPYGTETRGPYLGRTARVGSYAANAFGLYDLHGNVWEWCADWYGPYRDVPAYREYGCPVQTNETSEYRVLRGGSWYYHACASRAAIRRWATPGHHFNYVGFRVCVLVD